MNNKNIPNNPNNFGSESNNIKANDNQNNSILEDDFLSALFDNNDSILTPKPTVTNTVSSNQHNFVDNNTTYMHNSQLPQNNAMNVPNNNAAIHNTHQSSESATNSNNLLSNDPLLDELFGTTPVAPATTIQNPVPTSTTNQVAQSQPTPAENAFTQRKTLSATLKQLFKKKDIETAIANSRSIPGTMSIPSNAPIPGTVTVATNIPIPTSTPVVANGQGATNVITPAQNSNLQSFNSSSSNITKSSTINSDDLVNQFSLFDEMTSNQTTKNTNETLSSPKQKEKKFSFFSLVKFFILLGLACCCFLAIFAANVISTTPKVDPNNLYAYLNSSSILYDDEGNSMGNITFSEGSRIILEYDEIPENMVNAIIAIEDKTFWEHHGFNVVRIIGATLDSILGGGDISGTSTLTQQLARNVYLTETMSVRSLSRKVSEAYYALVLESVLSKEEIIEAYLNTVFLGYNSYGIEAASQAYFSKSAKELSLIESAALASIPASPSYYALVEQQDLRYIDSSIDPANILAESNNAIFIYNGESSVDRRNLVLENMEAQGYIDEATLTSTLALNLKDMINPVTSAKLTISAYFGDYVVAEVMKDLEAAGYDKEHVYDLVYGGGLNIYTTMDRQAQQSILTAFADESNFPYVTSINYDSNKNILDKYGNPTLHPYSSYINKDGLFTLNSNEYKFDDSGAMTIYKDNRLNIYETTVDDVIDYSLEFKSMYVFKDDTLHTIQAGYLLIPQEYKSLDEDGNLVIAASFFDDYPDFFVPSENNFTVKKGNYLLQQEVVQPQTAMVITDYKTGQIKAMAGGREVTGGMLYNRALNPRQPGSSIKPIAVYSTALQQGVSALNSGHTMSFTGWDKTDYPEFFGDYWTAASFVNDSALKLNGKNWPSNSYGKYMGEITIREAIRVSSNAVAVRTFNHVTATAATENLKKMGITTVNEDPTNGDQNAAALALGGMTSGISPKEMASAYGVFGNNGVYIEPISYTKVLDNQGNLLLENPSQKKTEVLDPGVAYIMRDIMIDVVNGGTAGNARIPGVEAAGKTGTTDNNFDIWFCGLTPHYSAATWVGSDINLRLSSMSSMAASLWGTVMRSAIDGIDAEYFPIPDNVITSGGELFVEGTETGRIKPGKQMDMCTASGYRATPLCTATEKIILAETDEKAAFYCPLHNNGTYLPGPPGSGLDLPKEVTIKICPESKKLALDTCPHKTEIKTTKPPTEYCDLKEHKEKLPTP